MTESNIVILNLSLYVALATYCFCKYSWKNLTTCLSVFYAVSSFFSYLLYNFPLYKYTFAARGSFSVDSCLYLFLINFLLITSLKNASIDNCVYMTKYNGKCLLSILKFLCIVFTIILFFSLPESLPKFFSSSDLGDMRMQMYGNHSGNKFFFVSLLNRLFGSTAILILCIACIRVFLLNQVTIWDKYAFFVYAAKKIDVICDAVSRATMVFSLMELFIVFILFFVRIPRKIRKKIIICSAVILPLFVAIFVSISVSRFGGSSMQSNFATLRYAGESNLNFMGLLYPNLKEPFHGYSQIPLFRRMVGLEYNDGKSRDSSSVYDSYISRNYSYSYPVYIFYGLAGNYYSNWGKFLTLFIAIGINIGLQRLSRRKDRKSAFSIMLCIIAAAYIGKGIFYEDYRFESGNLFYVYLFCLYIYLNKYGRTVELQGVDYGKN